MVFSDVDVASRPNFLEGHGPPLVSGSGPPYREVRVGTVSFMTCGVRVATYAGVYQAFQALKSAVLEFLCSLNTCRARALLPHHKRVGAPESLQPQSPLEGSVRVPRLRPEKG